MASKTLKTGATLQGGKYKIERVLGQGTFGITYLASYATEVQGALGKMSAEIKVAVKEFFMNEINQRAEGSTVVEESKSNLFSNYRVKFRKEAQNLATLHHPHIVQVTDVFDENNTSYYVMQYIDGMSLNDYIEKKGRLPEAEAIQMAAQIAQALEYMHQRHMLHLDLKPGNVMLDHSGNVHLIDFGLSKQYNANGEPESSTSIGQGTPGYAPIEQAHSGGHDKTFQASIDVYALGATMYKMLTGQRPADASSILNDGFPYGYLQQLGVSPRVNKAVQRAMAPQRSQRYATAADFISALTDGAGIQATPIDDATLYDAPPAQQPKVKEPTHPNGEPSGGRATHAEPTGPTPEEYYAMRMKDKKNSRGKWGIVVVTVLIVAGIIGVGIGQCSNEQRYDLALDSTTVDYATNDSVVYDDEAVVDTACADSVASDDDEYMY